jgi:uncharacterized protein (TIGR02300 family)
MPAKDLGTKHVCYKCGSKFYDLGKPAPICPKCGTDQRESPAVKTSGPERKRPPAPPRPAVEPEIDVEDVEIEEEVEEAAEEEAPTPEDDEA